MTSPPAAPLALVTGASSGIGEAYARSLAARGYDVILVARRADRLAALASQLEERHGVAARFVASDLSTEAGLAACRGAIEDVHAIDVAVLNAGVGSRGSAWTLDREREVKMVRLNCVAVTDLAFHLLPRMVERGRGDLIVVSSASANFPLPFMATYSATKAFGAHLAEALAEEVRGTGVRAIAVLPGPTRTEFSAAGRTGGTPRGMPMNDPEEVVGATWRALARGRSRVSTGRISQAAAALGRLLPRRLLLWAVGRWGRPPR